jgi:hypothetical protein
MNKCASFHRYFPLLLWISTTVISSPNAKFLGIDIKDFYLGTVMTQYEYMHIPLQILPTAIIEQYNLTPLIHNNCVYVEIS